MSFFLGIPSAVADESSTLVAIEQQIIHLAANGCVGLNDEEGYKLFSYRSDVPLIPASLIKILTALVAFDELGVSYRFKTEFYLNNSGDLAIKGWGDPFLISEEIELIAKAISAKGIRTIKKLYLDSSVFQPGMKVSGLSASQNPYDALNGALVVNFNSLNIGKSQAGKVFSAENVTPLTPLSRSKGRLLKPGKQERINLTDQPSESLLYAGELFLAFFELSGIRVENKQITNTKVDDGWRLIYTHLNSHSLKEIIEGLFRYSNNFIANQIFLIIGAQGSLPASLKNSRLIFQKYITQKFNNSLEGAVIDEASGISKKNRMSCGGMMRILEAFRNHALLLHSKNGVRKKSGTLTGIYNYAGYFQSSSGLQPFVIMTDQPQNYRDRLVDLLKLYSHTKRMMAN